MMMDERFESGLKAILGDDRLKTDADTLALYGRDTCDMFEAAPLAIAFPESTREVRDIVLLANAHDVAIVPSGGRTGLSAGATATRGELVVSLERMNRILEASPTDRTVRCQAGVVTARLQEQALEMDLFYPVDFAATGSSQVGGNIATNAGGNRVIRYGMTRNWVAALQVVTGKGEVLELGRGLIKDNTGYELQQLFIGSEGTLGIITEATMRLTRAPSGTTVLVLGLDRLRDLLPVLGVFQAATTLSAFEFFTEEALAHVVARHGLSRPFDDATPVYALIEIEAGSEADQEDALEAFERCMEEGWVSDGVISRNSRQARDLWRLREDISGTLAKWQPYKNDLSVPISDVPEFLDNVATVVADSYSRLEVVWYGHIGDGNVHINILKPDDMALEDFKARCSRVSEGLFELVRRFGGSVSAEHGVGLLKKPDIGYTRSQAEITLMRTIKSAFDPNGIMNPGKIFDPLD